jgi:Immunity protein 26
MARKKIRPKVGDVFRVPLDEGMHAYGHVLSSVLHGYYAIRTDKAVALNDIVQSPVAFRVKALNDRIEKGEWPIVGNIAPPAAMNAPLRLALENAPDFFLLYEWTPQTGGHDWPVSADEVKGLEEDGIWDSYDVPRRLEMFFRGEQHPSAKVF